MIRKIPKEVKVPTWVRRSDYWNKKTWSMELGVINYNYDLDYPWEYNYGYDEYSNMFDDLCTIAEHTKHDVFYYFTTAHQVLNLRKAKAFYLPNLLWSAYMVKKYNCEVYIYETKVEGY